MKNKTSIPDHERLAFKVIETPEQRASLYDPVRREILRVLTEGYDDYTSGPSNNIDDYVYVVSESKYYYDPLRLSERCVTTSNILACPAQIQLPFFGFYNIVIVITLIFLIYIMLNHKKSNK